MIEQIRDVGPVALIPAAWIAAALAILGVLSDDGIFIAHVVMVVFITFFAITGWRALDRGALRVWRAVLIAGLPVTLCGVAGFVVSAQSTLLFSISLVGWLALPTAGLAYTGRALPEAKYIYLSGAILSLLGVASASIGIVIADDILVLAGITVGAVGQTTGIVDASLRDSR